MRSYPEADRCPEHGIKLRAGPRKKKKEDIRHVKVSEKVFGEAV